MRDWLDSATIKHLSYALVYWLLTWASVSLDAGKWDWKYLAAGADMVETNTFGTTSIVLGEYDNQLDAVRAVEAFIASLND